MGGSERREGVGAGERAAVSAPTKIKICGIKTAEAATVAASAGADYLGFNFVEGAMEEELEELETLDLRIRLLQYQMDQTEAEIIEMVPTSAAAIPTLNEVKRYGIDAGRRSLRKLCKPDALYVRNRSSWANAGDCSPFTMPTVTGKKLR